jgi:two-component system, OmpR family, sensor kinase
MSSSTVPPDASRAQRLLETLEHLLAIETVDLSSALMEISQRLTEVLQADKIDIFLHEEISDALVAAGTSDTPMGRHQHAVGLNRLPLVNGGRAVETYRTGAPLLISHTEDDPLEVPGIRDELGVRSSALVPLDVHGHRRGVVSAVSARPEFFDDTDLDFLHAVARWIGNLIHRIELTERLRVEAANEARQQTADEMISVLAHDLRTPLTPLFGYAEMIRVTAERDGPASTARAAAAMLRGLHRLRRMIDDLLQATRLERGLFAVNPYPVELTQVIRHAIESAGLTAEDIEFDTPVDVLAVVDPPRVQQALENLLSNARRFTPAGTQISVRLDIEERGGVDWAVISVRDRGPGIAPELQSRLFTRFARGATSRGLGLGLYIADGIARAHGGSLTAESRPGDGATFHLALPHATRHTTAGGQ